MQREKEAGAFSVDLVGEDASGRVVVIENQLEKSNHDHLGKLVTYSAAVGAGVAVWIVADARPEHVAAVAWLNEMGGIAIYVVKVEAIRISESPPAPLLTPDRRTERGGASGRKGEEGHRRPAAVL